MKMKNNTEIISLLIWENGCGATHPLDIYQITPESIYETALNLMSNIKHQKPPTQKEITEWLTECRNHSPNLGLTPTLTLYSKEHSTKEYTELHYQRGDEIY